MPSMALGSLLNALGEVDALEGLYPAIGAPLAVARAVGRAGVVLLSGHFERYFYAINEEATTFINGLGLTRAAIPAEMRLLHSKQPIDELGLMQWTNRADKLEAFSQTDRWLWRDGEPGLANHERLLMWMKSPEPESLVRYYRYWGIPDIFAAITRTPQSHGRMRLRVGELVNKRNSIAHGDFGAQASRNDVRRYATSVREFCSRADRVFGRRLRQLTGAAAPPW